MSDIAYFSYKLPPGSLSFQLIITPVRQSVVVVHPSSSNHSWERLIANNEKISVSLV